MKNQLIIYAILGLVLAVALYLVFRKLGLIDTRLERKARKKTEEAEKDEAKEDAKKITSYTSLNTNPYFNPANLDSFLNKIRPDELLNLATSNYYAKEIHSSLGLFDDDEERIFGVFRNLKNKFQVTQIAKAYYDLYKKDLALVLIDYLNKDEVYYINEIVNQLKP